MPQACSLDGAQRNPGPTSATDPALRYAPCGLRLLLDDLEKIAQVLGVKVVELFYAPGRTAAERVVLGLLEGEEFKK